MHLEKASELTRSPPPLARAWLTGAIAIVAIVTALSPKLWGWFLYDRALIANGQWWRLWTCHLAHHGTSHLFWNLAVFIPAGVWLERIHPRAARLFLAIVPGFISSVLLLFDPTLQSYAGLSGIIMGAVTLLALLQLLQRSGEPRWFWAAILLLIVVKIAVEFRPGQTALFAGLPAGIRNVPCAHLAGAFFAAGVFLVVRLKTAGSRA